jgi:hypothetical protein
VVMVSSSPLMFLHSSLEKLSLSLSFSRARARRGIFLKKITHYIVSVKNQK